MVVLDAVLRNHPVEGQIGWFHRNHLVPGPEVATLTELNGMIDRWGQEDENRRIRSRPRTIGEYLAARQPCQRR